MEAISFIFVAIFGFMALLGICSLPLAILGKSGFARRDIGRALGEILLGTIGFLFFALTIIH